MQVNKISKQERLFAFYRETDLYVSRLLIKLLTLPRSDRFTLRLWRHLADQTRHASLWSEHLELLGTHNLHLDINALCDRVHRQKAHGKRLIDIDQVALLDRTPKTFNETGICGRPSRAGRYSRGGRNRIPAMRQKTFQTPRDLPASPLVV